MPEVVARQLFEYDRRMYAPGDRLTVEDRFVRLLVTLGRVEELKPEPPCDASGDPYRTAAIAAAPSAKSPPQQKQRRHRESIVGARRP